MPYKDPEQQREAQRVWAQKNRERQKTRIKRKCQQVQAFKLEKGCARCGYSRSARALDCHHPNGKNGKKEGIAELVRHDRPWSIIKAALLDCEIICSNCHREEHDDRINLPVPGVGGV
jgi:hypothetical protein